MKHKCDKIALSKHEMRLQFRHFPLALGDSLQTGQIEQLCWALKLLKTY